MIDINLKGVFLSMKYELPHLVASRGAIVNMTSVAGLSGVRLGAAYCASKHGVVGLTKAAAIEYADRGVRVNAVAPAVIATDMAERAFFRDDALTDALTNSYLCWACRHAARGCGCGRVALLRQGVIYHGTRASRGWGLSGPLIGSAGCLAVVRKRTMTRIAATVQEIEEAVLLAAPAARNYPTTNQEFIT